LPLSLEVALVGAGAGEGAGDPAEDFGSGALDEPAPASCQAGMVGRPVNMGIGDAGALGKLVLRLRSKAFSDLSSCWSSAMDCFSLSLLFSIICGSRQRRLLDSLAEGWTFGSISCMFVTSALISRISSRVLDSPSRISFTAASTSSVVLSTFSFCSSTAWRTAAVSALISLRRASAASNCAVRASLSASYAVVVGG
jgi:hypothetical protein